MVGEQKALWVQTDGTIFLKSDHKEAKIVQPFLSQFAQLIKTPSLVHIYKLSPFSVWYALEQGITMIEIIDFLESFSEGTLPEALQEKLTYWSDRNGKLELREIMGKGPCLYSSQPDLLDQLFQGEEREVFQVAKGEAFSISIKERGSIKQFLMAQEYPVIDRLGVEQGSPLSVQLKKSVKLRPYQKEAVQAFIAPKGVNEGNGFIILPCGSGKTIVGLGVMHEIKEDTLILVPNDTSLQQWQRELVEKTSLNSSQIGIYTSEKKEVKSVTITTYQMLTYHHRKGDKHFPHYGLFHGRSWGLVIYDEVHLLPAPLFRLTSNLQGKRRLGLTATFVREDGKEGDIYSLIGPKRYEVGIKPLEENGWIAKPVCMEIKIPMETKQWEKYLSLSKRERFRFASENKNKLPVVSSLLEKHKGEQILIIGQYLDQLHQIASYFEAPLITGEVKKQERQRIYDAFRRGEINLLVLSRVANLAVDLPDAQVAIQVSGTYGSRQEEAQRIGRLLRPKNNDQHVAFYTIVTSMTQEEEVASNRQLFMTEQGYSYEWEEWSDVQ